MPRFWFSRLDAFEVINLHLRTQVRNNRSSAARVCPAAPPHGIDVRPSRVTADARRSDTPGTSPAALALRVPTPHNKYVAGSAPAARALRPTWPSSVCGSRARWRVFSNRSLVAERWWATSATSERYVVIGRAYQVTLAAAPHWRNSALRPCRPSHPRSSRRSASIVFTSTSRGRAGSRRKTSRFACRRWPVHLPPSSSGDPRQR